jgi:hypothetical protein
MDELTFITEIRRIFLLAPAQRLPAMNSFHHQIYDDYIQAVKEIANARAESPSSDGRVVKQVVGHIMEWDRYTLICLGQLISGVKSRRLLWKNGYVDKSGERYNFSPLEAFNAFQAERQVVIPWELIQQDAIALATILLHLLDNPEIITTALLEDTESISPELYDGKKIPIPCGWFLWYVILDHSAVEHARDLYIHQ